MHIQNIGYSIYALNNEYNDTSKYGTSVLIVRKTMVTNVTAVKNSVIVLSQKMTESCMNYIAPISL